MAGYIGTVPAPQATQIRQTFTATASQTTFTTTGYTDGAFINVYLNGVRLINGTDYTATNGSDANILNQENRFDLALLDQNMPGIDGIDTLKKIKSYRQTIPVIMITKSEDEWLMDEAISQQIDQFLIKPVSPNQIYMACKQILEKNKIIEDKTTSEYLQDFQRINQDINFIKSLDEWWERGW